MTNPADANDTGRKAGQQQVSKKEMGALHREEENRGDKADRRQVHLAAKALFALPKERERKPCSMLQGAGYRPGAAMSFNLLNPPTPVSIIGNGDGFAVAMIDQGLGPILICVTAINTTAEIWCASNLRGRMQGNWSLGRDRPRIRCATGTTATKGETATAPDFPKTESPTISAPKQSRADEAIWPSWEKDRFATVLASSVTEMPKARVS